MVGLQKRYAPAIQLLKKRLSKEHLINYDLHYLTGAYLEGDALLDLYIHPLDLVCYLFGKPETIASRQIAKDSYILMLQHPHIVGTLELSTTYSWTAAEESLKVCTRSGIYRLSQMEELVFTSTPSTVFGIPIEKLRPNHETRELLFLRNNFTPILVNNQIHSQGYFNEIENFIDAVEGLGNKISTSFRNVRDTYEIIFKIKKT
jgi:virulence factor